MLLSLSIKRHFLDSVKKRPYPNSRGITMLRVSGIFCFVVSCVLLFKLHGTALGLVYFTAILTATSLMQTFLLSYLAQWLIPITLIATLISPAFIFQGNKPLNSIQAAQVNQYP
jgi:hypothetical protein